MGNKDKNKAELSKSQQEALKRHEQAKEQHSATKQNFHDVVSKSKEGNKEEADIREAMSQFKSPTPQSQKEKAKHPKQVSPEEHQWNKAKPVKWKSAKPSQETQESPRQSPTLSPRKK